MLRNTSVQPPPPITAAAGAVDDVAVLSLATFNPARALPPYLTSPRSLEACRVHGINPIELVEISVDEFRKDFPNDPDAALRRFARIDGARRRLLTSVTEEWNKLCEMGWTPQMDPATFAGRERIIDVPPEIHSTMLELQAGKFRKAEEEQWRDLQRTLAVEIKRAYEESRNREILRRHQEIQANNDAVKQQRQAQRTKAYQDKVERAAQLEEEERQRIADFQAKEYEASMKKLAQDKENARKRKEWLETERRRKLDKENEARRQREEYFKDQEDKFNKSKQLQQELDRRTQARMKYERDEKMRQIRRDRERQERKIENAKREVEENLAKRREMIQTKERDRDEKVLKNLEDVFAKKKEVIGADRLKEKIDRAREQAEEAENEKIEKTKADLEYKEAVTRQELERVRDAQERRRNLKAIRQEAFELAAVRHKKAEDHRAAQLAEAIWRKEERCRVIKEGEATLDKMRSTMKEVIQKATWELRDELGRLQDQNILSPEKVIERMAAVSETVLFPTLQKRFGAIETVPTLKTRAGTSNAAQRPRHGHGHGHGTTRATTSGEVSSQHLTGGMLYTPDGDGLHDDSFDDSALMMRGTLPDLPGATAGGRTTSATAASSTGKRYTRADADARMRSSIQPERILSQSLDSLRMAAVAEGPMGESHWNRHAALARSSSVGGGGGGHLNDTVATEYAAQQQQQQQQQRQQHARSVSPPGRTQGGATAAPAAGSPNAINHAMVLKVPEKEVILAAMERAKRRVEGGSRPGSRPASAAPHKAASTNQAPSSSSRSPARAATSRAVDDSGLTMGDLDGGGSLTLGLSDDSEILDPLPPGATVAAPHAADTTRPLMKDGGVVFRASGYPALEQYMFQGTAGGDGGMGGGFGHLAGGMGAGGSFAMSESSDGSGSFPNAEVLAAMTALPPDADAAAAWQAQQQQQQMQQMQMQMQYTQQMQQRPYTQSPGGGRGAGATSRYAANTSTASSTPSAAAGPKKYVAPALAPGLFRRELSADHPLAGGKGEYRQEKSMGLQPYVGSRQRQGQGHGHGQGQHLKGSSTSLASASFSSDGDARYSVVAAVEGTAPSAGYQRMSPAFKSMNATHALDPTRRVEHVRREQNEALLRVLDEERRAEENRVHFLRDAMSRPGQVSDVEKTQLEQLFAEERRKASERIVQITKAHEQNLKNVMLDLISARTS